MKKLLAQLTILSLLGLILMPLAACAPSEEEQVEEQMEETGEEIEAQTDDMGEGMEAMGDEMEDTLEERGEEMEEEMEDHTEPPA